MRITSINLLLSSSLFFSALYCQENTSSQKYHDQIHKHSRRWINVFVNDMSPEHLQLTTNIIYLLYTNGLLDTQVRKCAISLSNLSRAIKTKIAAYNSSFNEVATLKVIIDKLGPLSHARNICNQMLYACEKTCQERESLDEYKPVFDALDTLQLFGQEILRDWAQNNAKETTELCNINTQACGKHAHTIQTAANYYKGLSQGSLPTPVGEENKNLAMLETAANVATKVLEVIDNLNTTIDQTNEHILHVITIGTELYKVHYTALYELMRKKSLDTQYTTIIFGLNGILPQEYQTTSLPHPDNILDHALEMTKFIQQKELF